MIRTAGIPVQAAPWLVLADSARASSTPGVTAAPGVAVLEASELYHADLKATNTAAAPDTVSPRPNSQVTVDGHRVTARFKPGSWNVIVTTGR